MLFKLGGLQKQILISTCLYLGQMTVGFTSAWTGPIFAKLVDPEQSPLPYSLSETEMSLVASLMYVGAIPGPYLMGWLSNVKGRKPCLIAGGVVISSAYAVLVFAKNLAMLYCGRMLAGLGIGIIAVMNLVYIGEIASVNIRGILLTAVGIFTTCGSIVMFSVGPYFSYSTATSVGLVLGLTFTLCVILVPETPIYYVLKDNECKVREKLKDLDREKDIDKILASKSEFMNTTTLTDWKELIMLKGNRKALFIVVTTNILQHSSGIFAVVAFSSSIFEMAGSAIPADIAMIIIGFFQLSGSITAPFFIERNGRKTLMALSCMLCSLSMLTLGLYFYFDYKDYSGINNIKWLPLVILILFFLGYDVGLGIIPNVLIGEMFTSNVRSKGSAVATTAYGAVVEYIGAHVAFWFFSGTCMSAFLFTIFFVPETKGKTLLDIQEDLSK